MGSIEEALRTAGAQDDLQTILEVLEDRCVGFKCQEAAAGPFVSMDARVLTGLNTRMLCIIKRAQQQVDQGSTSAPSRLHPIHIFIRHMKKLPFTYQLSRSTGQWQSHMLPEGLLLISQHV